MTGKPDPITELPSFQEDAAEWQREFDRDPDLTLERLDREMSRADENGHPLLRAWLSAIGNVNGWL